MIQIYYTGKGISLNQFYNSHWTVKQRKKEDIINAINIKKILDIENVYKVKVLYNGRNDVDNVVPLIKVILDYLRRNNYLIDDNPNYFKSLSISYDNTLAKDFYLIEVSNN